PRQTEADRGYGRPVNPGPAPATVTGTGRSVPTAARKPLATGREGERTGPESGDLTVRRYRTPPRGRDGDAPCVDSGVLRGSGLRPERAARGPPPLAGRLAAQRRARGAGAPHRVARSRHHRAGFRAGPG